MLLKMLLAGLSLTFASSLFANTLDLNVGVRRGVVNIVDWKGTEFGFAYLFDIHEFLAFGPYLSSTNWTIRNDAYSVSSTGSHRELGPEIRFTVPLETLDFTAGAAYSLVSKGTVKTEAGQTADLALRGFRLKIGLGMPLESGCALNFFLSKGLQDVEVETADEKVKEALDEYAFTLSLSF